MPNTTWNELCQVTKLKLLRNESFGVNVQPGPSTTHSHLEVFKIIYKITWSSGQDKSKGTCRYHWFMEERKMIECQDLWLKEKLITFLTCIKMKGKKRIIALQTTSQSSHFQNGGLVTPTGLLTNWLKQILMLKGTKFQPRATY